jgi:G3E family GTPase
VIAVHVLTGFLGSGKTTLLQHMLRSKELADTAIIVNELGEIPIDHDVLARLDGETVVMAGGCLCCAVRDDLGQTIRSLLERRDRGTVPAFQRLLIETTGLADPVPIVRTLLADPVLHHHVRPGNIIVTLDATHGLAQASAYPEVTRQLLLADHIVITKTDLASDADQAPVRVLAQQINPLATIQNVTVARAHPGALVADRMMEDIGRAANVIEQASDTELRASHTPGVAATCLTIGTALAWNDFGLWLGLLLHRHGDRVLRTKSLLNVGGSPGPVLVQSVHHAVYPPQHLDQWPSADRRTRIVVIAKDIARESIEASLAAFCGVANVPVRRDVWPQAWRER